MRTTLLIFLTLAAVTASQAKDAMIPTVERNGSPYVSLAAIADRQDIAIKQLPGNGQWVACAGERCAILKEVVREGDDILVAVAALAGALGATARLDAKKQQVAFGLAAPGKSAADPVAGVGRLAPNFRIARLDGTPVSLADFAGKRVLINSWASW